MSNDNNSNQMIRQITEDIELYKRRRADWERSLKRSPSEGVLIAQSGMSFCDTMLDSLEKRRAIAEGMRYSVVS